MANTSAEELTSSLAALLSYANGTGSVNLYMAHGGSNWGFMAGDCPCYPPSSAVHVVWDALLTLRDWSSVEVPLSWCIPFEVLRIAWMAGSGGENGQFLPQLTSYDYDAPISEAGASGQPGIGGLNKFQA